MIWLSIGVCFKWFWFVCWFELQMMWLSIDLRFKWFGIAIDLRFKWFGIAIDLRFKWVGCQLNLRFKWFGRQMIWGSSDLVVNWSVIQMVLVVSGCEIQAIWISNVSRFQRVGSQLRCDSNDFGGELMLDSSDLEFECFEIQVSWFSTEVWFKWFWLWVDVRFKWFGIWMFWDSIELVVNWFEVQMTLLSIDLCFKWFWLLSNSRFKWVGCQLMCDSNDFGCRFGLVWDSNDFVAGSTELVVSWLEIRLIWLSNDLRFNWFGCQLMCDFQWFGCELDLRFKWFGRQPMWVSNDSGCQLICDSYDFGFQWIRESKLFWDSSELVVKRCNWVACASIRYLPFSWR